MAATTGLKRGASVRFTIGPLGCLEHYDGRMFSPVTVKAGDTGRYFGPHHGRDMTDWHMIAVNLGGRDLFVPCHQSQFEAVV